LVLPKKQKLKNRAAFRKTFHLKLVTQNKYFKLLGKVIAPRANLQVLPKMGIVVSRKKIRQATKRNRAKRRLEEAFRTSQVSLLPELSRYDYLIFFLEAESLNATFAELIELLSPIKTRFIS
jgi:ribonuclease P protein component